MAGRAGCEAEEGEEGRVPAPVPDGGAAAAGQPACRPLGPPAVTVGPFARLDPRSGDARNDAAFTQPGRTIGGEARLVRTRSAGPAPARPAAGTGTLRTSAFDARTCEPSIARHVKDAPQSRTVVRRRRTGCRRRPGGRGGSDGATRSHRPSGTRSSDTRTALSPPDPAAEPSRRTRSGTIGECGRSRSPCGPEPDEPAAGAGDAAAGRPLPGPVIPATTGCPGDPRRTIGGGSGGGRPGRWKRPR